MKDQELTNVHEYQKRLIEATRIERMIKGSRPVRPSWSDTILLKFGNSLIAMGQRMKNLSSAAQTAPATQSADLSQECA